MSSVDQIIQQINTVTTTTTAIMYYTNFLLGVIGLSMNIFVLTRPSLRKTPCSMYFLSATFANLFIILVILPVRLLINIYSIDLTTYNVEYCKIQTFASFSTRALSCWLITMACIDRYLHSSNNASVSRLSSSKTAKLSIGLLCGLLPVMYCHMLIFYNIIQVKKPSGTMTYSCTLHDRTYSAFLNLWHLIIYSVCPSFAMLIFGCLTLRNIQINQCAVARNANNARSNGRRNATLLRMLLAQVLLILITTGPRSAYQIYALFTNNVVKDIIRTNIENSAGTILGVMSYFAHSTTFYTFTLSGSIFRKKVLKLFLRCSFYRENRVHTAINCNR
ncbi:unnamed protein product [Adineta ricciae]|uniref:G-protein coupled receptors family 1 profile domain-containing protein n=1 Tax=Adineta ricciae TaxID=249248 RepID=A0A815H0V4_ADIRI|nr:unnamed protein product [Adineta ricciae]CAF1412480.1 unnamed protein product [Adineta ricciae]